MMTHSTNASEQFLRVCGTRPTNGGGSEPLHGIPAEAETALLDTDAELALRSFYEHIWLVCQNAPGRIRNLGRLATRSYLRALRGAGGDPSGSAWRDFIRAVWTLLNELDQYPAHASWRWRDARGSLIRIVVENVDLLETRSLEKPQG